MQIVGEGAKPSFRLRRLAPRHLRALLSGAITLLACIILISGSGKAALDRGGITPSLGLAEGLRPAMLSAGGVLAIVAILLRHLAEGRLVAFVSMLVAAAGLHWAVGVAPALGLASPSVMICCLAFAAIILGTPLPHAFIAAAYVAVAFGAPMPEEAMAAATLSGMPRYLLTAIPFFLLAGALLTRPGLRATWFGSPPPLSAIVAPGSDRRCC
nr:TRAP transporter large permease subunit [Ensifer sp. NM-2]